MNTGDMIKVVTGETARLHPPWLGMTGIILRKFPPHHPEKPGWYEVFVDNQVLQMGEDYLELVDESR